MFGLGALIILGMMLGGVIFWIGQFVLKLMGNKKWVILTPVYMQRGNSIVTDLFERGRILKTKEGYSVIRLKKRKDNIRPPKYDMLQLSTTAQPIYPIFMTARGQYFPIRSMLPHFQDKKLTLEDLKNPEIQKRIYEVIKGEVFPVKMDKVPRLEVVEESGATNWAVLERKRIFEKYKPEIGWFEKYGQYFMNIIFMAVLIFVIIFMMTKFAVVSSSLSSAASSISQGLNALAGWSGPSTHITNTTNMTIVP